MALDKEQQELLKRVEKQGFGEIAKLVKNLSAVADGLDTRERIEKRYTEVKELRSLLDDNDLEIPLFLRRTAS